MIMGKPSIIALAALSVGILLISTSMAQDTLLINYQGRLTDEVGTPVTGTLSLTFTIYNSAGDSQWTESHSTVQVDDGLFNVILGVPPRASTEMILAISALTTRYASS